MVRLVAYRGPNMDTDDDNITESVVELYADTKEEVTPDMEVVGLYRQISPGSTVYTATGEVAIYNSNKEWRWV